jgi:hypothetical protein
MLQFEWSFGASRSIDVFVPSGDAAFFRKWIIVLCCNLSGALGLQGHFFSILFKGDAACIYQLFSHGFLKLVVFKEQEMDLLVSNSFYLLDIDMHMHFQVSSLLLYILFSLATIVSDR